MKAIERAILLTALFIGTAQAQTPGQTDEVVWSFTGGMDGSQPRGNLLAAGFHSVYGTTSSGGVNESGTVFVVDPHTTGTRETTIYNFTGGTDGSLPSAGVIQDGKGALYGTAARDGAHNAGTVFMLTPPANGQAAWTETTIWSFAGGSDGAQPIGSLLLDRSGSGVLYGTTSYGGANGLGVVFSLTPPAKAGDPWTETTLWSFAGASGGSKPAAALIQDSHGNLYGTASAGGGNGVGTVYRLSPRQDGSGTWAQWVLHGFTGGSDGATPMGTLTMDSTGALYGTTQFGGGGDCAQARYPYYPNTPESKSVYAFGAAYVPTGGNECGVVFKLTPPTSQGAGWTKTIVWGFQGGGDGANPVSDLLVDDTGAIRGVASEYGQATPGGYGQFGDHGNVFLLSPPSTPGGSYTETTTLQFSHEGRGIDDRSSLTPGYNDSRFYSTETFGGATWRHVKVYGDGSVFYTE